MKKIVLLCIGLLALVLGIIGLVLPILPTTPFILLSAFCFAQSSARFHAWLINHRYFGHMIHNWQTHRAIPKKAKYTAFTMMAFSCGLLFYRFWASPLLSLAVIATVICIAVCVWMLRLPNQ